MAKPSEPLVRHHKATDGASTQWTDRRSRGALAERTGLEPATPGVTGRYSNQLNYRSVVGVAGLEPATYGL